MTWSYRSTLSNTFCALRCQICYNSIYPIKDPLTTLIVAVGDPKVITSGVRVINTVLAPGLVVVDIPAMLLLVLLAKRSRGWLDDVPELGLLLNPVSLAVLCWVAFGFAEDLGRWMTGWM